MWNTWATCGVCLAATFHAMSIKSIRTAGTERNIKVHV